MRLQELTLQFDKVSVQQLAVTEAEFTAAEKSLDSSLKGCNPHSCR